MNKLIQRIAADLNIPMFLGETEDDFINRILYSALGVWCLNLAERKGATGYNANKAFLTRELNKLSASYTQLFPQFANFVGETDIGLFIRTIYEELGVLVFENDVIQTAKYGRGLDILDDVLYFGLPEHIARVDGLGIISNSAIYKADINEILIKDSMSPTKLIQELFDPICFDEWDKDTVLEFFDPLSKSNISSSWKPECRVKYTFAKNPDTNDHYRVICDENFQVQLYKLDNSTENNQALTGCEYRRQYYALMHYYASPFKVYAKHIDDEYSRIKFYGKLPNRESFFLSFISWPIQSLESTTTQIIVRNKYLCMLNNLFNNLGIEVQESNK